MMRNFGLAVVALILAGCAGTAANYASVPAQIDKDLGQAAAQNQRSPVQSEAVARALLPPLKIDLPAAAGKLIEPRFDLAVNNAPAREVFMGIVSGSRYSMLVHPDVTGAISVHLKDVTVLEALDALRDLYGYEYKVDGGRVYMQPIAMQTRVFKVNYLTGMRKGTSDIRVLSGSVSDAPAAGTPGTGTTAGATPITSGAVSRTLESSRISTTSTSDFWTDLTAALRAIVGAEGGRNVIVNPQSGVVVVRAMPAELRNVAEFLKASQVSVERQVVLEAKIIEVRLNDAYQSGINWAAFRTGPNSRVSLGQLMPGAVLSPTGALGGSGVPISSTPGTDLANVAATVGGAAAAAGTLFGMAFQTGSFAALLSFLESQGTVHVLSSPRIATLNNQKAVLKVGTDEFFVTNVSTTTTGTSAGTTTTPSVTLQPFFSGIMLDVTPQIDENTNIILHIHPSVSQVSQSPQRIDLGSGGVLNLPLAKSNISETDSIVRAQDGQIVAIGGLMTQAMTDDRSQVPGLGDIPGLGAAFRQSAKSLQKRELVILLKATVVHDNGVWSQNILESQQRIRDMRRDAAEDNGRAR